MHWDSLQLSRTRTRQRLPPPHYPAPPEHVPDISHDHPVAPSAVHVGEVLGEGVDLIVVAGVGKLEEFAAELLEPGGLPGKQDIAALDDGGLAHEAGDLVALGDEGDGAQRRRAMQALGEG